MFVSCSTKNFPLKKYLKIVKSKKFCSRKQLRSETVKQFKIKYVHGNVSDSFDLLFQMQYVLQETTNQIASPKAILGVACIVCFTHFFMIAFMFW